MYERKDPPWLGGHKGTDEKKKKKKIEMEN